jgi:hypothetical protein
MRRHDANDRVLATVEQDVLSEQVSVTEPSRQKSVTDQDCVAGLLARPLPEERRGPTAALRPAGQKDSGSFQPGSAFRLSCRAGKIAIAQGS